MQIIGMNRNFVKFSKFYPLWAELDQILHDLEASFLHQIGPDQNPRRVEGHVGVVEPMGSNHPGRRDLYPFFRLGVIESRRRI